MKKISSFILIISALMLLTPHANAQVTNNNLVITETSHNSYYNFQQLYPDSLPYVSIGDWVLIANLSNNMPAGHDIYIKSSESQGSVDQHYPSGYLYNDLIRYHSSRLLVFEFPENLQFRCNSTVNLSCISLESEAIDTNNTQSFSVHVGGPEGVEIARLQLNSVSITN